VAIGDLLNMMYPGSALDPSRIAAAVVMGVGFIGSGLAFLRVRGEGGLETNASELTTAAGIWVVSAVGVASGLGLYVLAAAVAILTTIVFTPLMRFEKAATQ
jgi:putative Mg2+ transporter-C (MgtC) family protein